MKKSTKQMALLEWKRTNGTNVVCETLDGGWQLWNCKGAYKIVNKTTGKTLNMCYPTVPYTFGTQKSAKHFLHNHFNFAVTETQ